MLFAGVAAVKGYTDYYPAWRADRAAQQAVERASAELPKVYNNAIRLESMRYDKKTVYAVGTVLEAVPVNDSYKPLLEADMKRIYCTGHWQPFAQAKVSIEFTLKFESVFYRGIEWVFKETPETCGG